MTYAYSPEPEDWAKTKGLYLCVYCGDELGFTKKLTCEHCSSKSGREKMAKENEEIGKRLDSLREKKQWIYAEN